MIYGLLILIVALVIMDIVLKGCIEYRKWKKDENLLTDEELKQLSKCIVELMKANHVGDM